MPAGPPDLVLGAPSGPTQVYMVCGSLGASDRKANCLYFNHPPCHDRLFRVWLFPPRHSLVLAPCRGTKLYSDLHLSSFLCIEHRSLETLAGFFPQAEVIGDIFQTSSCPSAFVSCTWISLLLELGAGMHVP